MTPFEPFERSVAVAHKIDIPLARFAIGDVVRHRIFDFRGVIFDVDPIFSNSDEWYEAIPEALRPSKDQPFDHLLAENDETNYVAYVSQQNLVVDDS
ncbi:MAG TPA: heat shock protein HspQ, partial [Bryobacteraceae bacterium]